MSAAALVLHQFRFDQKSFWRSGSAVFFTCALPVILLIVLETIFGNTEITRLGVDGSTYYVPVITSLALIAATLVSLAFRLTQLRDSFQLKRIRGTPLPLWVFIAGRIGNALVISALMVALVSVIGSVYGVEIPWHHAPALLLTLAVGAVAFSCLGFALTAAIPSADAAPAITNAIVLPLYFISFAPEDEIPSGVLGVSNLFPLRHFFEAFFAAYDPATTGSAIRLGNLAVVAAWGVAGLVIAVRFFRWEPRRG